MTDSLKFKKRMIADQHFVEISNNGVTYSRPKILCNRLPYTYRCILHEFIDGPSDFAGAEPSQSVIHIGKKGRG